MALSPSRWIASSSTINKVLPASGTERPPKSGSTWGSAPPLLYWRGRRGRRGTRKASRHEWLNGCKKSLICKLFAWADDRVPIAPLAHGSYKLLKFLTHEGFPMKTMLRALVVLLGLVLLASRGSAADDLQKFLNAVPASTNTITVIRMQAIMQSPLAVREGWAKKREAEFHEGTALLPPTSDVVVIASKLIPGNLANSPTIALIPLEQPIADRDLAAREHGEVRPVGGEFVVLSSRNCYMVTKGKYLAIVSPAD